MSDSVDVAKWNNYYAMAQAEGVAPPWESTEIFYGLTSILDSFSLTPLEYANFIELGCGSSATCVAMAEVVHIYAHSLTHSLSYSLIH